MSNSKKVLNALFICFSLNLILFSTKTLAQVTIQSMPNVSFTTINAAIVAAADGDVINVAAGTYDEDVLVNKSVNIIGAGIDQSIVRGVNAIINPQASTFLILANNVGLQGFTITRNGNNVNEWNTGLDTAGVTILGQNCYFYNNKFTGNQVSIEMINTSNNSISSNIIDFNRIGILIRDLSYLNFIYSNTITNNWTVGIVFKGLNNSNVTDTGVINLNKIESNWYSQVENSIDIGYTNNISQNWLGSYPLTTAISSQPVEPDYLNQIPLAYGGTAVPPSGGAVSIRASSALALSNLVYSPYYINQAMTTLGTILPLPTITPPVTIGSTAVTTQIPAGVTVSTGPYTSWDGVINPPTAAPNDGTPPSGFQVGNTIIEVGSPNTTLYFSSPSTITLTGVNGPVGYSAPNSNTWTQITDKCGGTFSAPSNPLSPTGACAITNGTDTKIVTYHYTRFGNLISNLTVTIPPGYALTSGTDANTVYIGYAPASHITLTAKPIGGSGTYSYLWSNGATTRSIIVSPKIITNYTVTVKDTYSSSQTATVTVNVSDIRCGNKDDKNDDKVSICQSASKNSNGNTICIASEAVASHLAKGDHLGKCKITSNILSSGKTMIEITKNGTDELAVDKLTVQVAPNPAINYFTLNIRSNSNILAQLIVLDYLGRVVEIKKNISANGTLRLGDNYSSGIYLAQVIQGSERVIVKLIKAAK